MAGKTPLAGLPALTASWSSIPKLEPNPRDATSPSSVSSLPSRLVLNPRDVAAAAAPKLQVSIRPPSRPTPPSRTHRPRLESFPSDRWFLAPCVQRAVPVPASRFLSTGASNSFNPAPCGCICPRFICVNFAGRFLGYTWIPQVPDSCDVVEVLRRTDSCWF